SMIRDEALDAALAVLVLRHFGSARERSSSLVYFYYGETIHIEHFDHRKNHTVLRLLLRSLLYSRLVK
ncbi:hypothetical protein PMAYCL1PPCAC_00340, partial [Pristionchus mayeri]